MLTTATSRFLTAPIADELGFEHLIATEPEMIAGALHRQGVGHAEHARRQGRAPRGVAGAARQRLDDFRESWFYSDSRNDVPLLERDHASGCGQSRSDAGGAGARQGVAGDRNPVRFAALHLKPDTAMSARILDGKTLAARLNAALERARRGARRVGLATARARGRPGRRKRGLADLRAQQAQDSTEAANMLSYSHDLPAADTSEAELLALIDRLNADPPVHGILVQLPLPKQIDPERVTERIDPRKDVDGFHPYNIGRLVLKRPVLRPCTPYGCMRLLAETGEDLVGKHAVIIGQSNIVGRPMALELLMARCTVTVCHSATRDLPGIVRQADVLVAAVGKAYFVAGRLDQAGRDRHRRRHEPECGRPALRRRRHRGRRARGVDHAGARRRRPDDHRDAAGEHAEGRRAAGPRLRPPRLGAYLTSAAQGTARRAASGSWSGGT